MLSVLLEADGRSDAHLHFGPRREKLLGFAPPFRPTYVIRSHLFPWRSADYENPVYSFSAGAKAGQYDVDNREVGRDTMDYSAAPTFGCFLVKETSTWRGRAILRGHSPADNHRPVSLILRSAPRQPAPAPIRPMLPTPERISPRANTASYISDGGYPKVCMTTGCRAS